MDIWSWICELPESDEWTRPDSALLYELASSKTGEGDSTRSIQLRAERTFESNSEASLTFSVCLHGFQTTSEQKTIWVSDTCLLSSEKPYLPLLLQLLQEIIDRSPSTQNSLCPRSHLQKLKPDPISWVMDSHSPESFSSFFSLVFLIRLFWLCSYDAPSEVGSMYFQSLLGPNLQALTCKHASALRTFLFSVGVDVELCVMRNLGFVLAKWLLVREMGVGLQMLNPSPRQQPLGFSYATEAHGLWILKGYAPVSAMEITRRRDRRIKFMVFEAKEAVLRYTLAHQQLEAVIQLDYSVGFHEGYIQVNVRVDNLRFHVAKLGFTQNNEYDDYLQERHFPSRIQVWVGPEIGSSYVSGVSLGRSTDNGEKELETQRIVKGSFGNSKFPLVKARARVSTRSKTKNWRWDQDAQGNAAVFDAILCDNLTGREIATWKPTSGSDGFRERYAGASRAFTKTGGVVFSGDEYGEPVGWRVSRDMEGSVLKWRIGGKVWLSYWPNSVESCYYETRCVEWCDEVDLPLINGKTS